MKKLLNEDGSTVVEAAIVLPIVILAVISVTLMLIFLAYSIFYQVSVHDYLIEKEGNISDTKIAYEENIKKYNTTAGFTLGRKHIKTNYSYSTQGGGVLASKLSGNINSRIYEINEKTSIRYYDLFKDVISE